MQTTQEPHEPQAIEEIEYRTLQETLMDSDRGKRFLKEFLKRNQTPETTEILSAIHRLEKTVNRQRKVPDLDSIRLDIAEMHEAIERTKLEISNIKQEGEDSNRFVDASHELDAIVSQTEGATSTILEAAEKIQESAWQLREAGASNEVCDDIDAKSTEIFMACSFQDLTGQRTTKVVQVLRYLESRINSMIGIWGLEDARGDKTAGPVDHRPDAHLLNGPQKEGRGVSQSGVDDLMSANGHDETDGQEIGIDEALSGFDPIEKSEDADAAPDMNAVMDASDIDSMFDSISETPEEIVDASLAEAEADDHIAPFEATSEETEIVAPVEVDELPTDDSILDASAIDQLFDAEVADVAEEQADTEWEQTEEQSEQDAVADPLESMSEAERQVLFN